MRARSCARRDTSRRVLGSWLGWLAGASLLLALTVAAPATAQDEAVVPSSEIVDLSRIAVLPFRVHSGRAAGGLGERLADRLRRRLEATGEVAVLGRETSEAVPLEALVDDGEIRRLASELQADYLVLGSVTELAGRFSLDVRILSSQLGRPAHTRVWTASSEADLYDRIDPVSDAVLEHVVGAAPMVVTSIEIRGAAGFEADLAKRLGTQPGLAYDPAQVRADLASLRSSPAVVSAEAETERGDAGVLVRFQIVLASPDLAAGNIEAGAVISELRIRGNRRIEPAAIRARIASREGGRFDPLQVSRDISEVHALGFFRNVRAFSEQAPDGTRVLIFEVEENPVVRQISITGNDNIEADRIRDILTLTTGSTLDQPLLFENRDRVEALYRAEGYYLAEVTFEVDSLGEASVGINFDVVENEKLKLRDIVFDGNEHFSDSELLEGFQTRRWRFWSYATSWFDRSGTYSEPLFLQDLRNVERLYTDAGFLQARVDEPAVIPSEDGLSVSVDIDEGRRFKVGGLEVTGDSTVDIESLRDTLGLKEGDYFNRSRLTEDIQSLTEYYQDRGFYFAQVRPLSNLSEESEFVDVRFDVQKGPLYFIRRVNVAGNTVTVDPVVRREVPIVEGQLYSQRAVQLARLRIERLGFFEEVDFKVQPTDETDQLDLDVSVVERPTGSFSFGAGFSSQDGLVVTGSLAQSNLFGRGYGANISLDLGGRTQRYFINLSDPYFLGSSFSFGTTISRTTLNFEDFEQEQTGVSAVLGHTLSEDNRTRGFLRYSFDRRQLEDDSNVNAAAPILREVIQDSLTSSLVGLSISRDTRNDRFAPTEGERLLLSLEGAGLGGFSEFLRLEGSATYFLGAPRWLFDRSTFVFSTRAGWAVPFNQVGDFDSPPITSPGLIPLIVPGGNAQPLENIDRDLELPLTERYFLGGLGQFGLRGFQARSVGPRRTILQELGGGVFTPLGYAPDPITGELTCQDDGSGVAAGNANGVCNDLDDRDINDFEDLDETDVVGGNKFIVTSFEYRFPISETVGLQGVLFFDMGNTFDEEDYNLFDVEEWRYGTGAGVQWFSPFGPLAVILGFPLDRISDEDASVFEFSVGGQGF